MAYQLCYKWVWLNVRITETSELSYLHKKSLTHKKSKKVFAMLGFLCATAQSWPFGSLLHLQACVCHDMNA